MALYKTYRFLTQVLGPALPLLLWWRRLRGKEEAVRLEERKGHASLVRPSGRLIWINVASVGESLSVLPLIDAVLERDQKAHVLVTSTTKTSAALLKQRLPERAFHQFIPVDRPKWVKRFFDSWQPDVAIFVESELWPNLIHALKHSKASAILVNARISDRSFRRWKMLGGAIKELLGTFDLCLAQDATQAERFAELGARQVAVAGNLKLIDGRAKQSQGEKILNTHRRPCWIAASTHEEEEAAVLDIHTNLRKRIPDLLTLIAPRHPTRRDAWLTQMEKADARFITRSSSGLLEADHDIYLIDTLGELPEFYRIADVCLMCGSLVPGIGGHNPVEAAHRETALVLGPDMSNFRAITSELIANKAAQQPQDNEAITEAVFELLTNVPKRQDQVVAAKAFLAQHKDVLQTTLRYLEPFLADEEAAVHRDNVLPLFQRTAL